MVLRVTEILITVFSFLLFPPITFSINNFTRLSKMAMKGKKPKFSKSSQEIERQPEVKVVLILNAYTEPNSAQFFWISGETQRQNSNHLPPSYPFMPWLSFTPSLPAPLPTVGQQVLLFLCCVWGQHFTVSLARYQSSRCSTFYWAKDESRMQTRMAKSGSPFRIFPYYISKAYRQCRWYKSPASFETIKTTTTFYKTQIA